jgi:hypothetical protein
MLNFMIRFYRVIRWPAYAAALVLMVGTGLGWQQPRVVQVLEVFGFLLALMALGMYQAENRGLRRQIAMQVQALTEADEQVRAAADIINAAGMVDRIGRLFTPPDLRTSFDDSLPPDPPPEYGEASREIPPPRDPS